MKRCEVFTCEKCNNHKHYITAVDNDGNVVSECDYCKRWKAGVKLDDYCSYWEQKESESE